MHGGMPLYFPRSLCIPYPPDQHSVTNTSGEHHTVTVSKVLPHSLCQKAMLWTYDFLWEVTTCSRDLPRRALGFPQQEEASSEPALSTTELTQQQHPHCSVRRPRGFGHAFLYLKSILNQFITPPAAFFAGAGHRVQMLVAARLCSSCTLQSMSTSPAKKPQTAKDLHKITPKTSSYSYTMHQKWVVKSNAEHSLGSKKETSQVRDLG